jgi:2-polyprenyl-3-methyl-5-hydroxy-6-metoxy-1,4-benzoquinol methylase
MPHTTTNSGLHDFVGERVLSRYARPGIRAADLGSGPGAVAERLRSLGCDVVAVDRDAKGFEAQVPHVTLDFDQADFASQLGAASFGMVTAIEVIEHVESPNGFQLTRKPIAWVMRFASAAFSGEALLGDNHIFVVAAAL